MRRNLPAVIALMSLLTFTANAQSRGRLDLRVNVMGHLSISRIGDGYVVYRAQGEFHVVVDLPAGDYKVVLRPLDASAIHEWKVVVRKKRTTTRYLHAYRVGRIK